MQGLYSLDAFVVGVIIGFFMTLGFCGEGSEPEYLQKREKAKWGKFYYVGCKVTMLVCFLLGAYIFYTRHLIFVGYFAALLAGALIGQIFYVVLAFFSFIGRFLIYGLGSLSAPATAYAAWLYYSGQLVEKASATGLLKYLPGG